MSQAANMQLFDMQSAPRQYALLSTVSRLGILGERMFFFLPLFEAQLHNVVIGSLRMFCMVTLEWNRSYSTFALAFS